MPGIPSETVDSILERFNLTGYRYKPAGVLPEGVRKLLDIAMAMAVKPKILLLDEPTSGVSADEKFGLMDMVMEAVRAQQVTVLFVEHDMDIVNRYTHRVLAFYEGPDHRRRRTRRRSRRCRSAQVRDRRGARRRRRQHAAH